jgi:hypothetical protein
MSTGPLRAAIAQMEAWVADPSWRPDPEVLARWQTDFRAALAQTEKGPGWSDLMARAHAAGRQLEALTEQFVHARNEMKAELDAYERGSRALRGYRTNRAG